MVRTKGRKEERKGGKEERKGGKEEWKKEEWRRAEGVEDRSIREVVSRGVVYRETDADVASIAGREEIPNLEVEAALRYLATNTYPERSRRLNKRAVVGDIQHNARRYKHKTRQGKTRQDKTNVNTNTIQSTIQ